MVDYRQIVTDLLVEFEVYVHQEMVDGACRSVGFDIYLCGTNEGGKGDFTPSGADATEIWRRLNELAQEVIARADEMDLLSGSDDVRLEIRGFDGTVHQSPKRQFRSDIELVIEVRNSGADYFMPVDEDTTSGMEDVAELLKGWGARQAR